MSQQAPTPTAGTSATCSENWYTAPDIATLLERDPTTIYRAIERFGLKPGVTTAGGLKVYDEQVVRRLREELHRKPELKSA